MWWNWWFTCYLFCLRCVQPVLGTVHCFISTSSVDTLDMCHVCVNIIMCKLEIYLNLPQNVKSICKWLMFKNHCRVVITTSVLIIKFLMIIFLIYWTMFYLIMPVKAWLQLCLFPEGVWCFARVCFHCIFLFACLFVSVSFLLLLLTVSDLIWIYSVGSTKKYTVPTHLDATIGFCCYWWDNVQWKKYI